MARIAVGKKVPDFELPAPGGRTIRLSELAGKNVVLYFYPKDNTSGCSLEAQDFRDLLARFKRRNTVILGASRDSLKSHESFRRKYGLNFDLLSDEDGRLCTLFD